MCSRPTAVNLQIAATRLSAVAKNEAAVEGGSGLSVAIAVITAADAMMKDDIAANKASLIFIQGLVFCLSTAQHEWCFFHELFQ